MELITGIGAVCIIALTAKYFLPLFVITWYEIQELVEDGTEHLKQMRHVRQTNERKRKELTNEAGS